MKKKTTKYTTFNNHKYQEIDWEKNIFPTKD